MQIERIHEIDLTASDDAQIGALMDRCFDTDFDGRSYYQQRHHLRLVVRDQGIIVAHMALDLRAIRMGEELVTVVGLAEVGTDANFRSQGLASKLLRHAISEARQTLAEFFVLFGDRPLYAANGFRSYSNPLKYLAMVGAKTQDVIEGRDDGLMVLALRQKVWDGTAQVDLMGHKF